MSLTGMPGDVDPTTSLVERILMSKYLQRKFLAAILGVLLNLGNESLGLGLDEATLNRVTLVILGWIGVEGYVDAKNKKV